MIHKNNSREMMHLLCVDGEDYNISNLLVERGKNARSSAPRAKITRSSFRCNFLEQKKVKRKYKFVEDHVSLCSSHSSSSKHSLRRDYQRPTIEHLCRRIGIDVRASPNATKLRKSSRSLTRRPSAGCLRVDDEVDNSTRETNIGKCGIRYVSSDEGSYPESIENVRADQEEHFLNSATNIYQMVRRNSRNKTPSNYKSKVQSEITRRKDDSITMKQPTRRNTDTISQTSYLKSGYALNEDATAIERQHQNQSSKSQYVPVEATTVYTRSRNDHTVRDSNIYLQHQYQPPPIQLTNTEKQYLEVSPGIIMEVREPDETLKAIQGGYASISSCLCCQMKLGCVPDAMVVVCPDCRVLTPLSDSSSSQSPSRPFEHQDRHGIGLGQKMMIKI